jgi:Tc5 transposase DNA-binding domain
MDYEERMTAAFAVLDLQERPKYAEVAKEYKLERTTLAKRYKGQTVSRKVFLSESRQCLTRAQEEALIDQINKLTDKHIPPTSQMVKNFAEEMIGREVGKNWTQGFIRRHDNRLKSIYLRNIDHCRTKAEYAPVFQHFYDLVWC